MVCQVMGESASGRDFQPVNLRVFSQKREPFLQVLDLIPRSESVTKLSSVCKLCRRYEPAFNPITNPDASFSY